MNSNTVELSLALLLILASAAYTQEVLEGKTMPEEEKQEGRDEKTEEEIEVKDPDISVGQPDPELAEPDLEQEPPPKASITDSGDLEETLVPELEGSNKEESGNWAILEKEMETEAGVPNITAPLVNANEYRISVDVELRTGLPPSLANVTEFSDEDLDILTKRWTKFDQHCNYTRHRAFWKYFWTNTDTDETIASILSGSRLTEEVCNGLRYERCDKLRATCACDKQAIYDTLSSTCQLIEGGRGCQFGWLPIFKTLDRKRHLFQHFPLSCVPNSDCFNQIGCWDSRECEIRKRSKSDFKPKPLYSFCNPKKSSTLPYTEAYLESTIDNSINYDHWLKHGNHCRVAHNFGDTDPKEVKETLIAAYEVLHRNFYQMCNPFQNEACHSKKKVCLCAKGFLNQNGHCQLVPGNPCDWNPKLELKLRGQTVSEASVVRTVSCVQTASCKKVCVCQSGVKCPKYVEENWVVSTGSAAHSLLVYSIISTIFQHLWN